MTVTQLKNNKGFTLIELLIVIAILSILALLGYPRLMEYRNDARIGEIKGTGVVIGRAAEAWASGHPDALDTFSKETSLTGYLKNNTIDRLDEYTVTVGATGVTVTYAGTAATLPDPVVYDSTAD